MCVCIYFSFIVMLTVKSLALLLHGETFYINFYYSIFQFREKRITSRIFVSKNTMLLQFILKFHINLQKFSIFTDKNSQSDTFFLKLKNTILKIDIKSFSVYRCFPSQFNRSIRDTNLFFNETQIYCSLTEIMRHVFFWAEKQNFLRFIGNFIFGIKIYFFNYP